MRIELSGEFNIISMWPSSGELMDNAKQWKDCFDIIFYNQNLTNNWNDEMKCLQIQYFVYKMFVTTTIEIAINENDNASLSFPNLIFDL